MKNDYNLLIICPDQMRSDYLSCYGHPTINTKNIDKLSEDGIQFNNCYCSAPLCAPSRISMATSTYVGEHNKRNYWSTIDPGVPNLVSSLKNNGYRTGLFGKNHLFTDDKLNDVWDEINEVSLGNLDSHPEFKKAYSSFELEKGHEFNVSDRLTDETIEFMKKGEKPFLAWVNYQDPHPAFACPEPYYSMFDPEQVSIPESFFKYNSKKEPARNEIWRVYSEMNECTEDELRRFVTAYMGQIRYIDDCVGKFLEFLNKTGLEKNTIVVFWSDHGEMLGDYKMVQKIPIFYDAVSKVPLIIRHPNNKWKVDKFKGLMEGVDITPTLLDGMGIEIPPTMVGKSFVKELELGTDRGKESIICEAGGGAPTPKKAIKGLKMKAPFAPNNYGPGAMIRKGQWKLSIYADDQCELFNIQDDPHEIINEYENMKFKDIREELTLLLLKRQLSVKVRDLGECDPGKIHNKIPPDEHDKGGYNPHWPLKKYAKDVRFDSLE